MLTINELYDLSHSLAGDYLKQFTYPWEALAGISDLILEIGKQLPEDEYVHPTDWDGNVLEDVWVAKDATVFKTAYLHGPCIIGHRTEVRQCAFIRGSALVGAGCVVGNSVELKNVILFDGVQTPHYNYVGDSILGYKSHMGAGSITSNVKSDKLLVVVKDGAEQVETGRKKVGAMLGDRVEVTDEGGSVWMGRTSDSFRYDSHCVTVVEISHVGAPGGTQQSGSAGERRSSEMSELSAAAGSEGYAACSDDGQVSRETGKEGQA